MTQPGGGRRPPVTTGCSRPRRRRPGVVWAVLLVGLGLQLAGCGGEGTPSALNPQGPAAARIAGIWWFLMWTATAVFVLVVALIWVAIRRRRRVGIIPRTGGEAAIVAGGVVLPAVVLTVVWFVNLNGMVALSDDPNPELTIQVVGHRWWWEIRYPNEGFTTANELHIPTGRRVRVELTSADVIHSFWVPQLNYKTDMIPGILNVTWIQANREGTYEGGFRGQCAEYCGLQHARMAFLVVAQPTAEYDGWVRRQRLPATAAATPGTAAARGLAVLERGSCAACHSLRGTSAKGTIGPDLTHFGERRRLGAGTAPNIPGYQGGWIVNSQTLKPGNQMPPQQLEPRELQDVLAYFESQRRQGGAAGVGSR